MTVAARFQVLDPSRRDWGERPVGPATLCVADQPERARGKPQPLPGVVGDEDGLTDGRRDNIRSLTPSENSATAECPHQGAAPIADRAGVRVDREHLPACRTEDARAHKRVDHLDRRRLGDHLVPRRGQPRRCSDAFLVVVVIVGQLPQDLVQPLFLVRTRELAQQRIGLQRNPGTEDGVTGEGAALGTRAPDPCPATSQCVTLSELLRSFSRDVEPRDVADAHDHIVRPQPCLG